MHSSPASATIYNINQSVDGGSVVGTIQTDGHTGVLTATDIIGWNLQLNGIGASSTITQADAGAVVQVVGSDLTALGTHLLFNYSGLDDGYFLLQDNLFSGTHYYCDQAGPGFPGSGPCFAGASVVPGAYNDGTAVFAPMEGNQIIATSAVPLPAALPLFAGGVGALGVFGRWRKKRAGMALAA
jgi:hypothetical protein